MDTDAKPSRPSAFTRVDEPSATPSVSARAEKPSAEPTGGQPAPRTKEGAIQRYEQYLHALGREDIDMVCEVAGPAAKKSQGRGLGPCTLTYAAVLEQYCPSSDRKSWDLGIPVDVPLCRALAREKSDLVSSPTFVDHQCRVYCCRAAEACPKGVCAVNWALSHR
ncbi:hypothetical protein AB0I10_28845 [Streptomyces sp. NPDC050636]|uniref:hypothetical protein n=1 Tax=Streptomyces sp. NPDC050636 TaxID=3154510 RepID=UPI00341A66C9